MVEQSRQLAVFQEAHQEGAVSDDTLERVKLPKNQKYLALASGRPASEAHGDKVHLVTILTDNSGSMSTNQSTLMEGHNRILEVLAGSPQAQEIWVSTHLLCTAADRDILPVFRPRSIRSSFSPMIRSQESSEPLAETLIEAGIVSPYGPLLDEQGQVRATARLTTENFITDGRCTPLYGRSEQVLLSVLGKAAEMRQDWKEVTTATLIMSDGGENTHTPVDEVAKRIADLKGTGIHLVAAMGFGEVINFKQIFLSMGIDEQWILTTQSNPRAILAALTKFAEAAKQAAATKPEDMPLLLQKGWDGIRNP